ncbi:UNVERIFIED_CONTAM: hypothetical protein GTU68_015292 [Idotea baltica]|nr:hypothetical protein [Idotea baltica]
MKIVNTAAERFENLPDYDFVGEHVQVADDLKMHFVDAGNPLAAETILLMHGEPSWSYLYRFMIPVLCDAGYRVLVPDLIGFGKSSKPTETTDYTYAKHVTWTSTWLDSVNPGSITMFAQDWGGLIGLRLVDLFPDRFSRVCISNTGLPTGDHKSSEAFLKWQAFSQKANPFPFEMVMQGATEKELSPEELQAYTAPYPDHDSTAGARIFPALVPTTPDDPESENNRQAWKNTFMKWEKPFLTLFGDKDPVTKGGEAVWQKLVPGAKGQNHQIIHGGGHFIQEDKGPLLANLLIEFINDNPQ